MKHNQQDTLQRLVATKTPILLTGEAGTGKTQSAMNIADTLNIPYHAISVGEQTTKSDILGFIDANGTYRTTPFRLAFEHGGLFILDEVDAGNPNVLLAINTGLSNGFVEFPDTKVYMHPTFQLIATANTLGEGSNQRYVGRNKLDAATLNRFITYTWLLDNSLELALTQLHLTKDATLHPSLTDKGFTYKNIPLAWQLVVKETKKLVEENLDDHFIGMRNTINGAKLFQQGFSLEEVADFTLYTNLDEHAKNLLAPALKMFTLPVTFSVGDRVTIFTKEHVGAIGNIDAILPGAVTYNIQLTDGTKVKDVPANYIKLLPKPKPTPKVEPTISHSYKVGEVYYNIDPIDLASYTVTEVSPKYVTIVASDDNELTVCTVEEMNAYYTKLPISTGSTSLSDMEKYLKTMINDPIRYATYTKAEKDIERVLRTTK